MTGGRGKFLVCVPFGPGGNGRLITVGRAVLRVSEKLGVDVETYQKREASSIFVYYKDESREKIPVYSDWGKNWSEEEVYHSMRSVIYALSFHPKHLTLQTIRAR